MYTCIRILNIEFIWQRCIHKLNGNVDTSCSINQRFKCASIKEMNRSMEMRQTKRLSEMEWDGERDKTNENSTHKWRFGSRAHTTVTKSNLFCEIAIYFKTFSFIIFLTASFLSLSSMIEMRNKKKEFWRWVYSNLCMASAFLEWYSRIFFFFSFERGGEVHST